LGIVIILALTNIIFITNKKKVCKVYSVSQDGYDLYEFYLNKAYSYRKIETIHMIFNYVFKITGTVATIITIYFVVQDNSNFIVLFALLATLCSALSLIFPFTKHIETYYSASVIMETVITNPIVFCELVKKCSDISTSPQQPKCDVLNLFHEAYIAAEKLVKESLIWL